MRSAIGTNVFELRAGARREDVVYARANAFHWAYIVGCLVLLVALTNAFVVLVGVPLTVEIVPRAFRAFWMFACSVDATEL